MHASAAALLYNLLMNTSPQSGSVSILKSNGLRESFDPSKLIFSLKRVGAQQGTIDRIVREITSRLHEGMTTTQIYSEAFAMLKEHHAPTAIKYSIRRAVLELGPDGFPFERFIARIFQSWGYDTLVDQTILGSCVPHEIDVVAWNKEKLILVEAKYHNEFGMKSDLKVALYIQARREDVAGTHFDYGNINRVADEFWLITNTKFSEQAIHYGECKGLHMIGWNHPAQGNMHDIIEKQGLHPITCLTSITRQEKNDLIAQKMLVCKDLIAHPEALHEAGIRDDRTAAIIEEAKMVIASAK